jgi:hypothetical protein
MSDIPWMMMTNGDLSPDLIDEYDDDDDDDFNNDDDSEDEEDSNDEGDCDNYSANSSNGIQFVCLLYQKLSKQLSCCD